MAPAAVRLCDARSLRTTQGDRRARKDGSGLVDDPAENPAVLSRGRCRRGQRQQEHDECTLVLSHWWSPKSRETGAQTAPPSRRCPGVRNRPPDISSVRLKLGAGGDGRVVDFRWRPAAAPRRSTYWRMKLNVP